MSYYDNALKLKSAITIAADALPDETAVQAKALYDAWAVGASYVVGDRRQYADKLYKCLQSHTSMDGWSPELTPALWTLIDETHAGSIDDPIPYEGNMALENGKYYSQGGVIYLCTRDTINPVYSPLADLVGLYVEVA